MTKYQLLSALHFATEMATRYNSIFKEWQHHALNMLNDYCEEKINVQTYLNFIKQYNLTKIKCEYWNNEASWLQYRLNTKDYEVPNGTLNKE